MSWHTDRLKKQHSGGAPAPVAVTRQPTAEAVDICPTCGVSGDDPCVTPSGKVKDTWHAKRGS